VILSDYTFEDFYDYLTYYLPEASQDAFFCLFYDLGFYINLKLEVLLFFFESLTLYES